MVSKIYGPARAILAPSAAMMITAARKSTQLLLSLITLCSLLAFSPAKAQGTLSIALQQQFSFTSCAFFSNACGTPLAGGLLYFYQSGTVATRQDSFVDTGLTMANPWPLTLDASGRIPMFYLAAGSVHIRLTDSTGVVQFDIPSILVVGGTPSGGGGSGAGVDPTTIASTGDIKFRAGSEFLSGWVKANSTTIGSAVSGATQRANADAQALFVWLWQNCPDPHCPVAGGRGSSGLNDFNANKQITVMDLRGRTPWGLDDMGNVAAGRIQPGNITSGGSDTTTTPQATGGESFHLLSIGEMPSHRHPATVVDPGHAHGVADPGHAHGPLGATAFVVTSGSGVGFPVGASGNNFATPGATTTNTTGVSVNGAGTGITLQDGSGNVNVTQLSGGGAAHNNMAPFMLGTWYLKL